MVVIRIGRKRNRQASRIASSALLAFALALDREVDQHDAVLLHDADQQDDADDADHRQIEAAEPTARAARRRRRRAGSRGSSAGGRSSRRARRGSRRRRSAPQGSAPARSTASPGTPARCPGSCRQRVRLADLGLGLVDRIDGLAERDALRQVEGKRHGRKLALMRHRQRAGPEVSKSTSVESGTGSPVVGALR